MPVLHRRERGTLWPFMQWAMYKNAAAPGPIQAQKRRIIGTTSKGQAEEVTTHLLGLSITVLEARYLRPMGKGDRSAARALITRLNRGRDDPFVELRLESETYTVSDTGIVRQDNPVVAYRADSADIEVTH